MVREVNFPLDYLDFLKNLVADGDYDPYQYNSLFIFMSMKEFKWAIELDEDRAEDGRLLRYRFGEENGISSGAIEDNLDIYPCSILEMLIAMSCRCAERITPDTPGFEKASYIFWMMMDNLRLTRFDDFHFKETNVNNILERLMNREFSSTGEGGLFVIPDCKHDLRKVDFWYHLMWYLTYIRNWYDSVYFI